MEQSKYQHEVVVPSQGLPFKLFSFEGTNGGYVREKHWHRSIEIFAVWEGSLSFTIGEKKRQLSAGEFIIVNSNEVHSITARDRNNTVVLQIPQEVFADYFTDEEFIWFSHSEKENDHRVFVLLQEMYLIYEKGEEGCLLQTMSLYYELLYLLVTKYRKLSVHDNVKSQTRQLSKLSKITRYMKDHYAEPLSLEDLAAQFNYSPSYLSRMFSKHAGINFKDYLQDLRLEHAMRDMEETDEQIIDIALNCGFPSSKAFSNAFRSKYGMLPSDYKKSKK